MAKCVLVTGGAGYVGSVLVPKLLKKGYSVKVLDLMLYSALGLDEIKDKIEIIKGDIRKQENVKKALDGVDYVIHLAAISNDPSGNLDPELTRQVNYYGTINLLQLSKMAGVERFIFASSSSVYGIKKEEKVTENLTLEPITIYSQTKEWAEKAVLAYNSQKFTTTIIRPATVCGYSPRQRLDVVVNIFTDAAIRKKVINVNGGQQKRPNIHIQDMADLYVDLLTIPKEKVSGKIYNFSGPNHTLAELANIVKDSIGGGVTTNWRESTSDSRSYAICSDLIKKELNLEPKKTINEAVNDLKKAYGENKVPNPESDACHNIKVMEKMNIKGLLLN